MGYVVRFQMKPKRGMFKVRYGTLRMESRRTYKTRVGALKEARKLRRENRFKRYTFKAQVVRR